MTTQASTPRDEPAERWLLPAPPLRRRVLTAATVACVFGAGLALALHAQLDTTLAQPIAAIAVLVTMVSLAVGLMGRHHPFQRFGPANRVTLVRVVFVALASSLLVERPEPAIAWTLVALALLLVALDGVDGWLARRTNMHSAFGARFDMETDAFFMLVLTLHVWRQQKAGGWVLAIGLMRYAFVAAGRLWPWLSGPLRATRRGKAVAVVQVIVLGMALVPGVPVGLATTICLAALAALVWSFSIDVRSLWRTRR